MGANTNGHFAAVGGDSDKAAYEHGVQVIDENKEFKYVLFVISWLSKGCLGCRGGHMTTFP